MFAPHVAVVSQPYTARKDMKRVALIILGIAVLLGLALGVYYFFFSSSPQVEVVPTAQFGTENGQFTPSTAPPVGTPVSTSEEVAPRFVKITAGPVALGVGFTSSSIAVGFDTGQGVGTSTPSAQITGTTVRFIERASGNMYAYNMLDRSLTRITNQTIPGIVEASWVSDASRAFVRYLTPRGTQVETYALGETEAEGYFLEQNLSQATVGNTDTLITLLPSSTGSVATLAKTDGTNVKTLFSSELSSLKVLPAGDDFVAYTKASAGSEGYVFFVDGTTGTFTRLAGPLRGLTALPSHDGETVLISYRSGNAVRLELLDTATRNTTALPTNTLSEKCVWAHDDTRIFCAVPKALSGTLPDAWYQGVVSFSDRLWSVDVEARVATQIFDPEVTAKTAVDAVALSVDTKNDVLVFTNKKDGSLWLYDL